ncbi:MAG: NAD(P)-binding oxidoreductase, partial [Promethearchaeia archaeon]
MTRSIYSQSVAGVLWNQKHYLTMLGTAARQRAILAALALLMPSVEAFGHVPAGFSPKLHFAHARDTTACRSRTAGVVQLSARFMRDGARPSLERKDALWLLAAGSAALLAPEHAAAQDDAAPCTCGKDDTACSCNAAAPVVVIGAAGGTGGEVVRSLLRSQVPVVASTRRPVAIAARDVLAAEGKDQKPLSVDTLLLDKQTDETKLRRVIADAVKPDTLRAALKGARAVIFCAGTRPKVEATATPGTNPGGGGLGNNGLQQGAAAYYQRTAAGPEESAEDVGLVNVAAECVRQRIPRLVIVSSICAKCQRGRVSSLDGEQIDRGAASCDSCYRKQDGEQAVRNLYASAPAGLGYTVVRPGLLSRGPARGPSAVEFNQGTSKSGIISRADLADVLVAVR